MNKPRRTDTVPGAPFNCETANVKGSVRTPVFDKQREAEEGLHTWAHCCTPNQPPRATVLGRHFHWVGGLVLHSRTGFEVCQTETSFPLKLEHGFNITAIHVKNHYLTNAAVIG